MIPRERRNEQKNDLLLRHAATEPMLFDAKPKAVKVLRRLLVGIQRRTDPVTVGSTSVTIKGLFLLLLDEGNDSENEKKKIIINMKKKKIKKGIEKKIKLKE
ncbi:hypothetical protein V1478_009082, partial [Vespula squamosa]